MSNRSLSTCLVRLAYAIGPIGMPIVCKNLHTDCVVLGTSINIYPVCMQSRWMIEYSLFALSSSRERENLSSRRNNGRQLIDRDRRYVEAGRVYRVLQSISFHSIVVLNN